MRMTKECITMSHREVDCVGLLQSLLNKQLRQREVAERLGLSVRQVKRLVARYRAEGAASPPPGHPLHAKADLEFLDPVLGMFVPLAVPDQRIGSAPGPVAGDGVITGRAGFQEFCLMRVTHHNQAKRLGGLLHTVQRLRDSAIGVVASRLRREWPQWPPRSAPHPTAPQWRRSCPSLRNS
ncbi:helix-turn-helix domain-containing protein [Acidithiobacillus sp. IBUN Pt1247-S3]|uniref:helix-turn-helix domain-containing protein n=1 Tax=Acidithiobacillus sp. IBUN Pt1247-S3 TaxID=3166642 RepID=UPI0034E3CC49